MARLEFLRIQAFHAADAEPVSPDQIAQALALAADPEFDLTAHLALLLRYGALSSLHLPTEILP